MKKHVVYSTEFDERSKKFVKDSSEQNIILMVSLENFANDRCRAKGHIFLNEVLDLLDLPRERDGQSVGWVFRKYQSNVSFGVRVTESGVIELHFNTDGDILDMVWST